MYHTGNNLTTEPSWVPQWHQASEIGMIARMPGDDRCYNASLSESTEPKTSLTTGPEGGTRLLTRGIIFDLLKLSSVALDRNSTDAACNPPVEVAWSLFQPSNAAEVLDIPSLVLVCGTGGYRSDAVKETLQNTRQHLFHIAWPRQQSTQGSRQQLYSYKSLSRSKTME